MYSYEAVREKIKQIEGGAFQALAQRCYFRKSNIRSVNYSGIKAGSVKTVKSPYDALYQNNAGEWIFFEAGHISDRNQAIKKIEDDINKCLGYEKLHPELGGISSIACCYSCEKLTAADLASLQGIDRRVELISADIIAEACCTDYPWLSEEYLGIEISRGQICDVENFISLIENDTFAPSLATEFVGRQKEIDSLKQLLGSHRVVCISGRSGSGKTKIGIEAGLRFAEENDCDFLVIRAGHRPVCDDLVKCCSKDGRYLILLDDANDISGLRSIREFVSMNGNVRILATVRDYVKARVVDELRRIKGFGEFALSPLEDDEIGKILKDQFEVANQVHLDQIIRVSRGNLRLAILAAESLRQEGVQSIINVRELLSMCYGGRVSLFSENEKASISIASILGPHETENNPGLKLLEEISGIGHRAYLTACKSLYEKELLDMVHDFEAISFEEQNLRDYFIYQSIVENRLFTLQDIWRLPSGIRRVSSVTNTLLNVFYSPEVLSRLTEQTKLIWRDADSEERKLLIEGVGALIPSESLSYLNTEVQNLEKEEERANYLDVGAKRTNHFGFKSDVLKLASKFFGDADNWKHAFLIVVAMLEKNNTYLDDYCHIFDSLLKPDKHSFCQGYSREHFVLRRLQELYASTQDTTYAVLMIRFASVVLKDAIEGTEMGEGNQFRLYHGMQPYSDELVELRRECISCLKNLREDPRFRDMADSVVFDYVGQSDSDEPSLSKSTVDEIMAAYRVDEESLSYSLLNDIWTFRHRNAAFLGDENWIDSLFCSHRAFQLVEFCVVPLWQRYKRLEEFEEKVHATSLLMTEEDWILFVDLIRRDLSNGKRRDFSIVAEAISWVIEQHMNMNDRSSMVDALIDAIFELSLSPDICISTVFRFLLEAEPNQDIRNIVLSRSSDSLKAIWASCCDSYVLKRGGNYEIFCSDVLSGLASFGEVISAQEVLDAEFSKPGFLGAYCSEIAKSSVVGYDQKRYFVMDLANCDEEIFEAGISNLDNLSRVEELVCALLRDCEDFWFGESICKKLIQKDPDFIFKLLPAWIDVNSEGYVAFDESISDLYWETEKPIDNLPRLATMVDVTALGFYDKRALMRCISSIVKAGIEKGKGAEVLRWLSGEAVRDAPLAQIAIDVATSLKADSRLTFCVLACECDISVEAFSKAAFSLSFDGESWSGSAIPLIERKIDYAENLQEVLMENGYIKYLPAVEEYLQHLNKRKHNEEIREFIDPFWG